MQTFATINGCCHSFFSGKVSITGSWLCAFHLSQPTKTSKKRHIGKVFWNQINKENQSKKENKVTIGERSVIRNKSGSQPRPWLPDVLGTFEDLDDISTSLSVLLEVAACLQVWRNCSISP
jgi:hypothetical protein